MTTPAGASPLRAILALDPAWTAREPSGVALIKETADNRWTSVVTAPSYDAFLEFARTGATVDWAARPVGRAPPVRDLVAAARALVEPNEVALVPVDMPLSRQPIVARRFADNEVSHVYCAACCSTHSPSAAMPGELGRRLHADLQALGFQLQTAGNPEGSALIEVYPHPALLTLLGIPRRHPYKVNRRRTYWPTAPNPERRLNLVASFRLVLGALSAHIADISVPLPMGEPSTFAELKRFEDAVDALVCAWMGIKFLRGESAPLGDEDAAIWCPGPQPALA